MRSDLSDLDRLREQLELINTSIFKLIDHRKEVVANIQKLKGSSTHFDPAREHWLFLHMDLTCKSFNEILIFSLIIEEQAQANKEGSYPRWSLKEHIQIKTDDPIEMINPILLYCWDRALYQRLNFTDSYQTLFNNILNS